MAIEWGSNALRLAPCADLRRHPVKAHTRHLFQDPLRLGLYLLQDLSEEGLWKQAQPISCTQEAPQLRTRITHDNLTILTFDLSCMGSKSSPIPSDEYHSQDLVHGIGEKPSSTDCDGPCRAHTPKEVAGKVIGSRVHHVALAAAVSD